MILPVTSTPVDALLLRPAVGPTLGNGLRATSRIIPDKPMTVKADRVGPTFGHLDDTIMIGVNRSLGLSPGLAGCPWDELPSTIRASPI